MSTKYKQRGEVLDHVAAAALDSGDVVVMGDIVGVAEADIALAATGSVRVQGVHTLAAITGVAFAQGDQLYWDATNERLTKVSSGNTKAGVAAAAKLSATATGDVLLNVNT